MENQGSIMVYCQYMSVPLGTWRIHVIDVSCNHVSFRPECLSPFRTCCMAAWT